ncbi:MAG: hypothetical protein ACP5P1_06590 [Acidimicrobiales bacterium]
MAFGQAAKQEWAEPAATKLAAAQKRLAVEVAALRCGEDWRRFLDFEAELYVDSASNSTLIAVHRARGFAEGLVGSVDQGHVAGFATWRELGRSVERCQSAVHFEWVDGGRLGVLYPGSGSDSEVA